MSVESEIEEYFFRNEVTGAALLTGDWGCGKTYLVKEIADKINQSAKANVAVISLFGLESIETIRSRVKEEYIRFLSGFWGGKVRKIKKVVKEVFKDAKDSASSLTKMVPAVDIVTKSASTVFNIDVFKCVNVENTIGKTGRPFFIVFDDLERSKISIDELLGLINEYVENKRIKTLIISNEKELERDKSLYKKYQEYKEKVVSKIIKMQTDYSSIIIGLINKYYETTVGYRIFLANSKERMIQVFLESGTNNIRTIRTILADFERVYEAWIETDIPQENMEWVLYSFAIRVFRERLSKQQEVKEDKQKNISLESVFNSEIQFVDERKHNSDFLTLAKLAKDNIWDKNAFASELKNRYCKEEEAPSIRFMRYDFWSLSQKDIDEGLPVILKQAYDGKLNRRDLIMVLQKIHAIREEGIKIVPVDYQRIEKGLQKRNLGIKEGKIKEPECHYFSEDNELDEDAIEIYKHIEELGKKIVVWDNRKEYIMSLKSGENYTVLHNSQLILEEFDNELYELFLTSYRRQDNNGKLELARKFLKISFWDKTYSDESNHAKTEQNIRKLRETLLKDDTGDSITNLINQKFAEHIKDLLDKTRIL